MPEKTAATCIAGARLMLEHARRGQDDFDAKGDRTLSGLYAAVTSGRSVTFALQNMRGHVDGFDGWYEAAVADLRSDPVCGWFVQLRNRMEKQGGHGATGSGASLDMIDTTALFSQAPPGTEGAFVGDPLGRSGWRVRMPDGTLQDIYWEGPAGIAGIEGLDTTFRILDAPGEQDLSQLLQHYIDKLELLLTAAEAEFL